MEFQELYQGVRVIICPELKGKFTKESQGWNDNMDRYIGTEQAIDIVNDQNVMMKGRAREYHWDIRDLIPIPEQPELLLQGKKTTFDEKELIV